MEQINMQEWVNKILLSKQRIAIPIMTHPGIEMIGASIADACKRGDIHFQAIKKLDEIYPSAALTMMMDLTVEAEAFGAEIQFSEHEIPSVINRLLTSRTQIEKLPVPDVTQCRIPELIKANQLATSLATDKPLLSGCIGPFSLAGRLFGMTEIMIGLYTEPEAISLLLQKCTDFITTYLRELKSAGSNGVIMAEPAAGLLSNDDCTTYSSVYIRSIVNELQDDTFLIILHNCGNTGHCTQAMLTTGAAGYHFGNKTDMVKVLNECPESVLVMGNLCPVSVMKEMTADKVYKETITLLQKTKMFSNYVLSTGCDIPPHVPTDNIIAFYKALEDYNIHN